MKSDFFYDEDEGKTYASFEDWYKDIRYLIVPAIITIALGIAVYIYFRFIHV